MNSQGAKVNRTTGIRSSGPSTGHTQVPNEISPNFQFFSSRL